MASRNASFHEGVVIRVFAAPLKWILAAAIIAFGLVVLVWVVNWVFVFNVWPEGITRLHATLTTELERTVELARVQGVPTGFVAGTSDLLYSAVFRTTGVHDMGLRFAQSDSLSIPDTVVRRSYVANFSAIQIAMLSTQLLGVRVAVLVLMVPTVALVYLVAAADGLTQRAIRRACGGRESSSLYHRAKYLQVCVVAVAVLFTLALPVELDPHWTLGGVATALACLTRGQWSYYKKHV